MAQIAREITDQPSSLAAACKCVGLVEDSFSHQDADCRYIELLADKISSKGPSSDVLCLHGVALETAQTVSTSPPTCR
eukprot:5075928-Amphidinium_carterae.1